LPLTDEGLKKWIFERYKEKDELLEYFAKHQKFPGSGDEFLPTGSPPLPLYSLIWLTT
jgi:hypothetical protein